MCTTPISGCDIITAWNGIMSIDAVTLTGELTLIVKQSLMFDSIFCHSSV